MTVLVILGAAMVVFGAVVLLFPPDRPGGTLGLKRMSVMAPAVGVPLILAGLVAVALGSGAITGDGLDMRPGGNGPTTTGPIPTLHPTALLSPFSSETSLELSVTSGPPGTAVAVSGEGFSPRETIEINFATQGLNNARADDEGAFSDVLISIPGDWPFKGQVDIVATGRSSLRSVAEAFEVK
jgi:hypothetical protein